MLQGGMELKIKTIFAVLIVGLVIFSIWHFTPKRYNKTLNGILYQLGNEDLSEKISLHLDGKLHRQINGKITFKGTIEIDGPGVPAIPKDRTEIVFEYHGGNRSLLFTGFRIIDDNGRVVPDLYNYGWVYTDNSFSQFTIALFTDGDASTWSPSHGLTITAPAYDKTEALNISQKLMERFGITLK